MTSYLNGSTAHSAGVGSHVRAKRGEVTGWSKSAVRRHTQWLYTVSADELTEHGYALTLTLRDCPPSSVEFQKLRRAYLMRLERLGMIRSHWVIEWQRRGVPHLHLAVYFPKALDPFGVTMLLGHWVAVSASYGAELGAQHVDTIGGPLGWLQYLSKHAARGAAHYQRQGKPEGWEKTGRLWGYTGSWPIAEPMKHDMSLPAYWRYRRLVRSWRIANARAAGDPRRIKYARRMLECHDPKLSPVRGVSEWIPEEVNMGFLVLLAAEGHLLVQREE